MPWAHAHREAQPYLGAQAREAYEQGIDVRAMMRDRAPAEDILQVASNETVALIAMSAQSQRRLARWTCGGVADKVARRSLCPVLLVCNATPAGWGAKPEHQQH